MAKGFKTLYDGYVFNYNKIIKILIKRLNLKIRTQNVYKKIWIMKFWYFSNCVKNYNNNEELFNCFTFLRFLTERKRFIAICRIKLKILDNLLKLDKIPFNSINILKISLYGKL